MIPRRLRLARAHVASPTHGTKSTGAHFSVSVREGLGVGGCAVVVSKKVAALSVTRHRLKRRMLAVMRPWCTPDVALVVYARPGSAVLPFSELAEELHGTLMRILGPAR